MSHKFQITVPKKVREKMKLRGGDAVIYVQEGNRVYIAKSTEV